MDGIIAERLALEMPPFSSKRAAAGRAAEPKKAVKKERQQKSGSRAPALRMAMRYGSAGKMKMSSHYGLVREFRKGQTEVLREGTNKNVTNGPVRTAL
jgi:hypothetical protein